MTATAATVLLVLVLPLAAGYPAYFLQPSLTKVLPAPSGVPGCSDLPTQAYGKHSGFVDDADTVFTLMDASGKATAAYCPGQTYSLQIKFPARRLALVTTSQGTFSTAIGTCSQRIALDPMVDSSITKSATYAISLQVPCSATGSLSIKVISAASQLDSFKSATFSAAMDSNCTPCSGTPPPASTAATITTALSQISADMVAYLGSSLSTKMCAVPVQASAPCPTSSLGYKCSRDLGPFILHWTLGGCPPINACTRTSKSFITNQTDVTQQMLHIAVTARTSGYVAVGFAKQLGEMPGNDAVIGWASSTSSQINSYYVKSTSVSFDDAYSGSDQWLALAGVIEHSSVTTICFTRPILAPTAANSKNISTTDNIKMHYALGGRGVDFFQQHKEVGKLTLNLATNKASAQTGPDIQLGHGILMAVAWILLAPMGIMLARHKYLLKDRKWRDIHVWFITHRGIQLLAVTLFIISFITAMVKLSKPEGRIGDAHAVLGYLLVALAGCQVLGTFVRPKPGTPNRRTWNLFHWNMGGLIALTAIANVYIGIYVYSDSTAKKMKGWFISVSLVLVLYLCTELALQLKAATRGTGGTGSVAPPATNDKPTPARAQATIIAEASTAKL